MKNAIIYTRVSTDEQANKGYSLPHQKSVLEVYCSHSRINVIKHFKEDFSAKNFNRPAFNELREYVRVNKKSVDYLLFTRWDRFSRNQEEAYKVIREFKDIGVIVNAIEQPLDLSQPDSKVMLAVYLAIPEVENDKNSIRTREGMRRAMKEGCFTGIAPFGYLNDRTPEGKSTLKIREETKYLIQKCFSEYAKGFSSTEDLRKKHLLQNGFKISKQSMINMLKNPTYCGKILLKEYKKEEAFTVEGLHPAIVDTETFNNVQLIIQGKKKKKIHKFSEIDKYLPLRGYLKCDKCGRLLTGSASRGGSGIRHYYYHCQPKCKERFKAEEANEMIERLFKEFVIKEDVKTLYKEILDDTFNGERKSRKLRLRNIKEELEKQSKRLESIENKFIDDIIDLPMYKSMKNKIQKTINELLHETAKLKSLDKNLESYLKRGISFMHGIDKFYAQASPYIKKQIVGSIFPEKLVFLKNSYRTEFLDPLIALILSKHRGFKLLEIKNSLQNCKESKKAPPLGLEPRTL